MIKPTEQSIVSFLVCFSNIFLLFSIFQSIHNIAHLVHSSVWPLFQIDSFCILFCLSYLCFRKVDDNHLSYNTKTKTEGKIHQNIYLPPLAMLLHRSTIDSSFTTKHQPFTCENVKTFANDSISLMLLN